MTKTLRNSLSVAVLCAIVGSTAACSGDQSSSSTPAAARTKPSVAAPPAASSRPVYVAVGASETVGVGATQPATQAWPAVLHRRALRGSAYVNVGVSGSTVSQALVQQLPRAVAERPRVATVWLNVNDILKGVSPAAYEADLRRLVHGLRRDGATTVLVANTPRVDALPAYVACLPDPPPGARPCPMPGISPPPAVVRATVARYNAIITRVVAAEGAVLVDLHRAATASAGAQLTSADGFHPSTAGHAAVADAFARAIRRAGNGA